LKKAYLQLHASVVLWGFTAIFGRLITLRELPLVWYRLIFTCLSMLLLPGLIREMRKISRRDIFILAGIGCLVCLHWVCFYGSIKASNVSVALSCLATGSFMTAFIEPVVFRQKLKYHELLLGLLVIPGVYCIYYFSEFHGKGILLGLMAAFLSSLFTVLNKKVVERCSPRSMTFIELGSGFIFLSPLMLIFGQFSSPAFTPAPLDWLYLVLLAVACTTLPFVMALHALRHLSAFASTLIPALEPVYGIFLAILLFHEDKQLNPLFYLGTLIIILTVFIHPLLSKHFEKEVPIH
jgi:drug/metabolite transporter (DMT)-like permease